MASIFQFLELTANFNLSSLPRINSTTWNTIAAAVGCGDGTLMLLVCKYRLSQGLAPTNEQFSCMQSTSGATLEDAIISTNTLFNPVADGTYFPHFSSHISDIFQK